MTYVVWRLHRIQVLTVATGLVAAVCGAAITALVTLWSLAQISLHLPRISSGPFDIQGIAPVAYSVFSVALGIAIGSVFRRILTATAITCAVFVALRVVITVFVRPHYLSPLSRLVSGTPDPTNAVPPGSSILSNVVQGSHMLITYQPATRFWAFQGIEGIYLVLAAALDRCGLPDGLDGRRMSPSLRTRLSVSVY